MKANRKFIEGEEEGVSAVIGVILMVAITVAIAATVYVYVSGMIGSTPDTTPEITFVKDENLDRLTIAKSDSVTQWEDIAIRSTGLVTLLINGEVVVGTANDLAANVQYPIDAAADMGVGAITDTIDAGDFIDFEGTNGNALSSLTTISIIHVETNSVISTFDFATIAAQDT